MFIKNILHRHINEIRNENSFGKRQTLCKYCHMQKGKMGLPLFDFIKNICNKDLRMKATMEQGSRLRYGRRLRETT